MKKMIMFLSILCLIHTACNNYKSPEPVGASKIIHGIAATGAYMPDGSIVQVRPAPISTGNIILVGSYNGFESWVMEENPADVVSGTVVGNEGVYNIDLTNTTGPYIIRIQDPVSLRWYYSYASDSSEIANVNPYTDWMVRAFYFGRWFVLVDDCFLTGAFTKFADGAGFFFFKTSYGFNSVNVYWLNMPMPMPDISGINRNMTELQYVINFRWSVGIGDALTRNWVVGEAYDSILDGSSLDSNYITTVLADCFFADTMMDHGIAYYDTTTGMLHVDLWTPFNYCKINWPDGGGLINVSPIETVNGLNHYSHVAAYTTLPPTIDFRINDKPFAQNDPGTAFNIVTYSK
jgi:hypothetical protein